MHLDKDDKDWIKTNVTLAILENHATQKMACKDDFDNRYILNTSSNALSVKNKNDKDNEIKITLPEKIIKNPYVYIALGLVASFLLSLMAITGVNPFVG